MMIFILVLEKNVDNRISHFLVKISDMKSGLCDLMRDTILNFLKSFRRSEDFLRQY